MPPQVTFLDLPGGHAVPVKIIVRKARLQNASPDNDSHLPNDTVSVNSRSLVRIRHPSANYQLRLSSNYSRQVINEYCKDHIVAALHTDSVPLHKSLVVSTVTVQRDPQTHRARPVATSVTISIPVALILAFRLATGKCLLDDENEVLAKALKSLLQSNNLRLVVCRQRAKLERPQILLEDPDDNAWADQESQVVDKNEVNLNRLDSQPVDNKDDLVQFRLESRRLLGNVACCIKLYVSDKT